jgi:hypothetical protein
MLYEVGLARTKEQVGEELAFEVRFKDAYLKPFTR